MFNAVVTRALESLQHSQLYCTDTKTKETQEDESERQGEKQNAHAERSSGQTPLCSAHFP